MFWQRYFLLIIVIGYWRLLSGDWGLGVGSWTKKL